MENVTNLSHRVFAKTDTSNRAQMGIYYMVNINHPVIAELKQRYCKKKGIKQNIAMSDSERTEFELWLFQPSIRKMVEDICTPHEFIQAENTPSET